MTDLEKAVAAFEALPRLVVADTDLVRRGRFLSCDFELGVGPQPLLVSINEGRVAAVARGPFLLKPWLFAVRAEADVWLRFLEPYPIAGYHDLMALTKVGRARVEGNLVPFMGNLQFIKDVLAAPRVLPMKETAR
ncbi:MAG: hypothetical protein SFW09_15925 [Hyphomicrobiaceae bacterium]|nr:hypothetical protein [Hyphomicrobiaceae bacterium]